MHLIMKTILEDLQSDRNKFVSAGTTPPNGVLLL